MNIGNFADFLRPRIGAAPAPSPSPLKATLGHMISGGPPLMTPGAGAMSGIINAMGPQPGTFRRPGVQALQGNIANAFRGLR